MHITIELIPRTKKNSQQIVFIKGHPAIIPSKAYKDYEKESARFLPRLEQPIDKRINIQAIYYMPTRRAVDLTNLHEALHDVLVHHGVIADDNCNIIVSTDGSRVEYDKSYPRTEVDITEVEYGGLR